ncbi:PREDICTED: pentatricopeptide repeat-containing protein At4g38150-like [Nelumbo nucifera]|uniref:Pentatricopeptide repeat-containing protein At4g38150-like n=2 Tax=Nelumbo nucifera TaxID=4432 RepID=A0A1U8B3K1_NELNU|nr:PREDICTED: pentatricopeptide repeat-containing protein At4g38150-like [Nelumbo nucifera]XP_010270625.1 PREDICTED: pentatricopeptide repeat-containing protein At4g38150-like [Nelumbo nucifera]XP_019054904.1 PREDICTED: pentatricopeptide repeat-containing protein At4g38150-like [Nelumbo nucifera]DAD46432.1 TPA_asm: hypothetical protein HUJ06_016369 [Nelumbo nucifera]
MASKLRFSNLLKFLSHRSETVSTFPIVHHFSSIRDTPIRGEIRSNASQDPFFSKLESGYGQDGKDEERSNRTYQNPPNPIPNRPMRGEKRREPSEYHFNGKFKLGDDEDDEKMRKPDQIRQTHFGSSREGKREGRFNGDTFARKFDFGSDIVDERTSESQQSPSVQFPNRPMKGEKRGSPLDESFLEKLRLCEEKKKNTNETSPTQVTETDVKAEPDSTPQDADEIFRKMKETGLIPNAVAMLDGLCKDGLVQEAMKLFGLMREKGTFPEVVIYTAVVEGFCKAEKLDDAKRIFRKMQNNGISPNAFSYTVFIQGLYKGKRLEDAIDICVEMLEAGHSPNVTTFTGLVDAICRDKGVEEAKSTIERLREKGYFVDEKAIREYLDKKGPFSPLIWEAVFGKKNSKLSF